ncbi:MAG: cytochrome C oxidase subunit IV family protein [Myxococcota bacterium]
MSNHAEAHHDDSHYYKIYFTLLVLLTISIIGPMFGHKHVTLVTAFGIAVVKAFLVAKNFMHINLTPRYVIYTITTTLIFMLLFFAGTAPDVMKDHGTNWEKPSWIAAQKAYEAGDLVGASHGARITGHGAGHGEGHGEGHEAAHGEADAAAHGGGHEGGGH